MSITVHKNIVSGPEEELIPAHLSYGQFLYDKFKSGGDRIALVRNTYIYLVFVYKRMFLRI